MSCEQSGQQSLISLICPKAGRSGWNPRSFSPNDESLFFSQWVGGCEHRKMRSKHLVKLSKALSTLLMAWKQNECLESKNTGATSSAQKPKPRRWISNFPKFRFGPNASFARETKASYLCIVNTALKAFTTDSKASSAFFQQSFEGNLPFKKFNTWMWRTPLSWLPETHSLGFSNPAFRETDDASSTTSQFSGTQIAKDFKTSKKNVSPCNMSIFSLACQRLGILFKDLCVIWLRTCRANFTPTCDSQPRKKLAAVSETLTA